MDQSHKKYGFLLPSQNKFIQITDQLEQYMHFLRSLGIEIGQQSPVGLTEENQIQQSYFNEFEYIIEKVANMSLSKMIEEMKLISESSSAESCPSEVSVSSNTVSEYTVYTTTGLRKKRDNKKSILSRNVKEGSPLEEEYLVTFLFDLLQKVEPNIKQTKQLIQHLIYLNLASQVQSLRNACREYGEVASKCILKYYAQTKFEADHPEYMELLQVYWNKGVIEKDKGKERTDRFSIDSFFICFEKKDQHSQNTVNYKTFFDNKKKHYYGL